MSRPPRLLVPAALLLVAACGDDAQGPDGGAALVLTVTPSSVVLEAGTTDTLAAELRRPAGTIGDLTLRLEGAGPNVRPRFFEATSSGEVTRIRFELIADANASARRYSATLTAVVGRATSNPVSLPIEVTTLRPVTLRIPDTVVVAQLSSTVVPVELSRRPPEDAQAFEIEVEGAPNGVTSSANPIYGGATHTALTLVAGTGVSPGSYGISVTAMPAGVNSGKLSKPAVLVVTPSAGPTGDVVVDFRDCAAGTAPIWVAAYQPDAAGWRQVIGVDGQYRFNSDSIRGGLAFAAWDAGGNRGLLVSVLFRTAAELRSLRAEARCPFGASPATLKSVFVTTTAPSGADAHGAVAVGSAFSALGPGSHDLALGVEDGLFDVVGLASPAKAPSFADSRMVVVRDVDTRAIPSAGRLAAVDFTGPQAFTPTRTALSVPGSSEAASFSTALVNEATCSAAEYQRGKLVGDTASVFGLPAGVRRSSDRYRVSVSSGYGYLQATETFDNFDVPRTVALPPQIRPGPPGFLQGLPYVGMSLEIPIDSSVDIASFGYGQFYSSPSVVISASRSYLGSNRALLFMPNFAEVGGWKNEWAAMDDIVTGFAVEGHDGPIGPCGPRRTFKVGYDF